MSSDFRQEAIAKISERNREGAEILRQVALVLAEANRHLCSMQIELTQPRSPENSLQRSTLIQSNAEKLVAASTAWATFVAETVVALNQQIDQSLQTSIAHGENDEAAETEDLAERRVSARMIAFPDRRNQAIASEILIDPVQYGKLKRQATRKTGAS